MDTIGAPAPSSTASQPKKPEMTVMGEAGDLLQDSASTSAELLRWAESSRVGPMTIDDMTADLRSITTAYLKIPTPPLIGRARSIRDDAVQLLRERQRPEHARRLYSVAGWAMTVLGWISVDLARPDLADKHLRAAWVFAENAADDGLRAWVRATQHTAAFWREDYLEAAKLAQDGLRFAHSGSAAVFLSSAYALDLARAKQQRDATSALDAAIDIGARLQESSQADTLTGPFTCSIERATGLWSDTCLIAGNPTRSLEFASAAVTGFDRTPAARRNLGSERMVRCQEIKALVDLGYFDDAAARLSIVAETPPEHRIGPLIQRVNEISWMTTATANAAGVGEIRSTALEFGRHTSMAQLASAEE
ncbi:hypothetical protein ACTD5D_09620 [Nocardia takedensis]|uniref:hypothetical protein n=1 Tax=Nocardia takedensis TaxID=259390 RepID=UPI003F761A5E